MGTHKCSRISLAKTSIPVWSSQGLAISVGNGIAMTVHKVGADIGTCAQRGKPDQGSAQWLSTQRAPARCPSGRIITLKAAVNIWAESLFFVEKSLFFPEVLDYQISVWMLASFWTVVSVCANAKMERVMHLYISSGFGLPTGNPFCPKATLKVIISATFSGGWS